MRRNDSRARNHPGWWAFLIHRISGVRLALFLPLHLLALSQSLRGAAALDGFLRWAEQPLFKFAEWGLAILLTAHMAGGIRLLLLEFGHWQGMRKGMIKLTMLASMLMAVLFAWALLGS